MGLLADRVAYIGCPRDLVPKPLLLLSNQEPNYPQSKSTFRKVLAPWSQYMPKISQLSYSTCLTLTRPN
jgi:hypothetical protein